MDDQTTDPHLRVELLSQPRYLASVRSMISTLSQRLGFSEIECGQIGLAVDEALCNIINHGYDRRPDGRIWINLWEHNCSKGAEKGLRIVIEDRARQVDLQSIRSRDLDDIRPGGLGVYIIQQIMDQVRYEHREGGGMRLIMTKCLQPQAKTAHLADRAGETAGHSEAR